MSSLHVVSAELPATQPDVVVVDTKQSSGWVDFHELWNYRGLIWIFALRDITVRYRQTVVGIAWTVLQPLSLMVALNLFRKLVATEPSTSPIPNPISTMCGLILYQLFAAIINASTMCLVDNRQMLTKVYFPRLILPLSASLRPLVDFSIGILLLVVMMLWYHITPSVWLIFAPLVVFLTYLVALSLGLWLSALNAHYRDFGHVVPFALQLGLIVSPVAISSSHVSGVWRWLYFLNPMATLLEAFRWCVFGVTPLPGWQEMSVSLLVAACLLVSGAWYFRRVERFLADSI